MILVQVWAIPALGLTEDVVVESPQPVKFREVDYEPVKGEKSKILLFETQDPRDEIDPQYESHFGPIASLIARLSFAMLTRIRTFAARLIVNPPAPGETYTGTEFNGTPPGFPTPGFFLGGPNLRRLVRISCLIFVVWVKCLEGSGHSLQAAEVPGGGV